MTADRAACRIALLLILAALALRPGWRTLAPHSAARATTYVALWGPRELRALCEMGVELDPWGQPTLSSILSLERDERGGVWVLESRRWSKGPNGVDEFGAGDDLALPTLSDGASGALFLWGPAWLTLAALALLTWRFWLPQATAPRARKGVVELVRASALAAPIACVSALLIAAVLQENFGLAWAIETLAGSPRVSAVLLCGGAAGVGALAAMLWLRFASPTPVVRPWGWAELPPLLVALGLLAAAPLVQPLWRDASPRMECVARFRAGTTDPWGRPFQHHEATFDGWTWSAGPDGVSEEGGGDDLVVDDGVAVSADIRAFDRAPAWLVAAARLLGLGVLGGKRWLFPASRRGRRDV